MRYLFCILCIGLHPVWAQINEPETDSTRTLKIERDAVSKKKKAKAHKPEIWAEPFLRGQMATRQFNWLQNDLYAAIDTEDWVSEPVLVSGPFSRSGIRFDANLIGIFDNEGPGYASSGFMENLYVYYSIRASYTFLPKMELARAGHYFEFGLDGGARYLFTKWLHAEVGIMSHPLAMGYSGLTTTHFPDITTSNGMQVNGIESSMFQMYMGIVPYAKIGVYAGKRLSLDVSYGTNLNWVYAQNIASFATWQGALISTELADIKKSNMTMQGRAIKRGDISLNGRQIGFSFTYHLP